MIKLIIFDGEGVLYSASKTMKIFLREYEKFLKKFGVDLEEQSRLWFEFYPKTITGKISLREVNKRIYKKLGIPTSKVDERLKQDKRIWFEHTKLNKGVTNLLLKIKKKGIKVAILSDTVHPLKWRLEFFKRVGLVKGKYFDKLFLSNLIGYEKPHPKAYLTVLKYFKVKPAEALFVGHDKEEIDGAKNLGIKTISFSSLQKIEEINLY
jgi:HAD superfamily hydrolase (TIGR01509 family)